MIIGVKYQKIKIRQFELFPNYGVYKKKLNII